VLVPQLTLEHLAVAFYADEKENAAAHRSAAEITDRLKAGQNFATLSKMYSKDEASAAMGGLDDAPGQLLPEVEAKLKTAKAGDTLTVASRRGLHVIRVGEAGQPLEQIYIQGSDFQQWLTTQLATVPVRYLVSH
jgi:parvulin-like peptidyl-prolyl isomerase